MTSILGRLKVLVLVTALALGLASVGNEVRKAHASSPPTMTWGTFTGSITGGGAVATIGTAVTGQRIIVLYANLAATGAGIVNLYEKTSTGALVIIATANCAAAGTVEFKQNDYFGGAGFTTGSGSSLVLLCAATLTVTGNVRYLAN